MSKAISIIIPTYNEQVNITPLVEKIDAVLSGYDYEVVFVDDNSRDGTAETIEGLASKYPVRVIVRRDERGLASAVVHGINNTSSDIVAVMDADLQHPPDVLPALIRKAENDVDIVVASRNVEGGGSQGWSLARKIISAGAIIIAHLLLPPTRFVKDPMSGFFVFRRSVIAGARLKPSGYKILLEIIMEGKFGNVAEVPYTFATRSEGKSKLNTREQIEYLKHIYSLMLRKGELARFFTFCAVGGSGVLVNLGLYSILTRIAGLETTLSAAISVETSILTNFILNNFFTFRLRNVPGVKPFFHRLLKFNLFSLAGLAINLGLLRLFHNVIGIHDILSMLFAIIVVMLWNYLVNTWWTWR